MEIPFDRDDQTELPEEIRVDFDGRLRARVQERHHDYCHNSGRDDEGEWIVSDDTDPYTLAAYRTMDRFDTRLAIETVEEAYAVHGTLAHYTEAGKHGVTWLNPMSAKAARRVRAEIREKLNALDGVTAEKSGLVGVGIELDAETGGRGAKP